MKSRITHTIHFDDYTPDEMAEIFHLFVQENNFILEDFNKAKEMIGHFCRQYSAEEFQSAGNGRLMRKLFDRTLEEKICSSPEDLVITTAYIQNAVTNLLKEKKTIR